MSYILDALRKADAQRERDASRGIHAQAVAPASSSRAASRMLGWGASAAGIAAIVIAGLYFTRTPSSPAVAKSPVPATAPAALEPAPPVKMLPPQEVAKTISPPPPPPSAAQRGVPANPAPGAMSSDDRARMAREAVFGRGK